MSELLQQPSSGPLMAYVWGLFFLIVVPLLAVAAWRQIYPHIPLVLLLLAPLLLSVAVLLSSDLLVLIALLDALILLAALVDLRTLPARQALSIERDVLKIASLNSGHRVSLSIANQSTTPCRLEVRDDTPAGLVAEPAQFMVSLSGRSRAVLTYQLRAQRRGQFQLQHVYIRAHSKWGLWQRVLTYPLASVIHVYPDMKQLQEYALLARTNRLSLVGVRRARRVGEDNEFERLRDHLRDDNFRHIDWRATARRQKLTVRQFQTNQSQRLLFMVDCGRMMINQADGLSLLDHALNATLMLAYVALCQGDAVGLLTFSDRVHNYLPPRGGRRQMNHLLHASFNRFPQLVESRYDQASLHVATHCRKRSLIVLLTNVIDEVNARQVQQYLACQTTRHLPLAVLLRERSLFAAVENKQPSGSELYRAAAAAEILSWRREVLHDLTQQGVLVLDAFPEQLTAPLVNQYLEIKARHLL